MYLYDGTIVFVNRFKNCLKKISWQNDKYCSVAEKLIILEEKFEDIGFDPIWGFPQKHIVKISQDRDQIKKNANKLSLPLESKLVSFESLKRKKILYPNKKINKNYLFVLSYEY